MVFEYILKKNGIDPKSDLTIDQSIDFGLTAAAFTSNDADYTVEFEPFATSLEKNGDGYVGGMLYGVTQGWSYADCMKFGWACGALAASYNTDFALPISEEQVWNIYKGNARIKR